VAVAVAATLEDAPERAERLLLDAAIDLYKESGDEKDFEPTVEAGKNAVITAWARAHRSDSTERAILTFETLKNFAKPDIITHNAVLSACSHDGMDHKAAEMLEWLEATSETNHGKLQPDIISYNHVLTAFWQRTVSQDPMSELRRF
jgi:hypothetical protein